MYTYTYNGKKYSLAVSDDQIVLRTRNARKLSQAVRSIPGKKVLEGFKTEAIFKESDVSVLKLKKSAKDNSEKRDEARAVLKSEPDLRFAGRVLVDSQGNEPVIYTENLVIKFKPENSKETCERIIDKFNLKIKKSLPYSINTYFVSAPEGTGLDVFQLSESILNLPEVEFCHPELIRRKSTKVVHPQQWHLQQTIIGGLSINAHSNVVNAHAITKGEGIIIAIIDDGVDINHPEFNIPGKVVSGRDATLGINDPLPKYGNENHGTACAGVACAEGVNASGVAPKAKLMPIRHAADLGSIEEADAIYWAVDQGADIISCSWGPVDGDPEDKTDPNHFLEVALPDITRAAIQYAVEHGRHGKGCPIFWAAGNGGEDVMLDGYASNPDVIAVGACNDNNKRSVYSDFGEALWCCFPSDDFQSIDPVNPAPKTSGIYTTDRVGSKGYSSTNYISTFGGTSSATPGVAGVAALMLAANPSLTHTQVKQIIKESCQQIDLPGGQYKPNGHSNLYGYGKIDAVLAVQKAKALLVSTALPDIKIVAALVNPQGLAEVGKETVTIKNTGPEMINLESWELLDDKLRKQVLNIPNFGSGQLQVIRVTNLRLKNTGGAIAIRDATGREVHRVVYSKNEGQVQGAEIQFS